LLSRDKEKLSTESYKDRLLSAGSMNAQRLMCKNLEHNFYSKMLETY